MIRGPVLGLGRDLRYGIRGLLRNPFFSIVALLTLAIGIGANTAVFSVVDGVLLKPLPYPQADALVAIWHTAPGAPGIVDVSGGLRPSPSMVLTYADENTTFEHVGLFNTASATVTGEAEPEAAAVTQSMASVLYGVEPLDGLTYAAVALVLAAAAASYLPARQVSAVDPAVALAAE